MRRWFVLLSVLLLLVLMAVPIQAAGPPDEPPGLERAIAVKERHAKALLAVPGVAGVAVGLSGEGRAAVTVFTETPGVRGLPDSLEDIPVVVHQSGKFVAHPGPSAGLTPRDWWPSSVPIGVSTGHPDITAGTIGARVKDISGPNVYALSNNHVYANENKAGIGDIVLQPGTADGGKLDDPTHHIGRLSAFIPIDFTNQDNKVDAAIALNDSTRKLDNRTPPDGYGIPKSTPAAAKLNMKVKKYGRTTGLTNGQVVGIHADVNVQYGTGLAHFVDQIVIGPRTFAAGGDSGSLIVTDVKRSVSDRQPVGLLFAGSLVYTVANPIQPVLDAFGVKIDGE